MNPFNPDHDNYNSPERYNKTSLDTVCGSLCYAMGVEPPELALTRSEELCTYVDEALGGKKADRIFMYNPDAIAQWLMYKYPELFRDVEQYTGLQLPLRVVMPSVTPVCYTTMYTGAQPEVHGILKRQTLTCDTIFDALIRAGKKIAIVATDKSSVGILFRERDLDYYYYENMSQYLAISTELILKDEYDVIVAYSGYYDSMMHKFGPESPEAFGELRTNVVTFGMMSELIAKHWKHHNTLVGFAMDHGCHSDMEVCKSGKIIWGDHGFFVPADMNITHFYKAYPENRD